MSRPGCYARIGPSMYAPDPDDVSEQTYDAACEAIAQNMAEAGDVADLIQKLIGSSYALSSLLSKVDAKTLRYPDGLHLMALAQCLGDLHKRVWREVESA